MDSEFEALPHCAALGMTNEKGLAILGGAEKDLGIVRFGVMGLGCVPQEWAPVVDPTEARPCVARYGRLYFPPFSIACNAISFIHIRCD